MTINWLQMYLDAVNGKVCTQVGCTTCGALKFRRGVIEALGNATGQPAGKHLDRQRAIEISKALAGVAPQAGDVSEMEAAVRCLLFDLWNVIPGVHAEIESLLDGTWAGGVLTRMKAHHAARQAAQCAHETFQVALRQRRDEKKRIKEAQHRERLERKKKRDRLWRERQVKPD